MTRPEDEVQVEGSWFVRANLPETLAWYIREVDRLEKRRESALGELAEIRNSREYEEWATLRVERDAYRDEVIKLKGVLERVQELAPISGTGGPNQQGGWVWVIDLQRTLYGSVNEAGKEAGKENGLKTPEEKIAFRKEWDARVEAGLRKEGEKGVGNG